MAPAWARLVGLLGVALDDGEQPLEVRVEPRQLSYERRHRRLVEAVAHLRAEELAHAADSSRAESPRFLSPKKRNPFQRVPAISVAIADSDLYRRPSYSKASAQTVTS